MDYNSPLLVHFQVCFRIVSFLFKDFLCNRFQLLVCEFLICELYKVDVPTKAKTTFNVGTIVPAVIFIGVAIYLYITHDKIRTEYEYTFTNGALDFAMVFNNKKRKSLGSLNVATVDAFGKVSSGSVRRHTSGNDVKHLRWFLNREAELYYIAFSKESQKSVIIFEPSEEMVGYIKHYLPYGAHQEN